MFLYKYLENIFFGHVSNKKIQTKGSETSAVMISTRG